MLKKILLVGVLTVASFVSVNLAAHQTAANQDAARLAAADHWPCDLIFGGTCKAN